MSSSPTIDTPWGHSGTSTDLGIDRRAPRVIEVIQTYRDTVLDVRHLDAEEPGLLLSDAPPRHRPPIATGVGLAPLAVGCGCGAATGNGALAAAGATLSLLGFTAALLADGTRRDDRHADLYAPADALPGGRFQLVQRVGDEVIVHVADGFEGALEEDGERFTLEHLVASGRAAPTEDGHSCVLPEDGRFTVRVGELSFTVRLVHAASRSLPAVDRGLDLGFLGLFLLLSFCGLVLGVVVRSTPFDPHQELVEIPARLVVEMTSPVEAPEPERKALPGGDPDAGEGRRMKGAEGRAGRKDARIQRARGGAVARRQADLDRSIAESSGLLRDLQRLDAPSALFGDGGLGRGAAFTGGLIGSQYGHQYGSGGIGSRGAGLGGGGDGEVIGGVGTRGLGPGGSGYGSEGGYVGVKSSGTPSVLSTGEPILLGALRKDQIDRVIKAHLAQIRYCYQKELNRDPSLEGKVTIRFVIDRRGHVSRATVDSSSLGNAVVEQCVAGRFMGFTFPEPRGGGIVIVTYPFIFNAG